MAKILSHTERILLEAKLFQFTNPKKIELIKRRLRRDDEAREHKELTDKRMCSKR